MKNIKTFLAVILVLAMALCLCACGEDTPQQTDPSQTTAATEPSESKPAETEPSETEPSETEPSEPVEYDYSITVQDVDGKPFEGIFVQLCRGESCCLPGFTNADGSAFYSADDLVGEGDLIAKINVIPEGYRLVDGKSQITLTDDVADVVFVLEAVVDADYTITVETTDGTALENVFVQLCRGDACCLPGFTNAKGSAYFYEKDLVGEGELTAKISVVPEGYLVVDGVSQITLTDDMTVVTFVLEAIPAEG